MNPEQIIRAWKDEGYRSSLSEAELSALPQHPAGLVELSSTELDDAVGGTTLLCAVVEAVIIPVVLGGATELLSCYRCATTLVGTCKVAGAGC